MPASDELVRRLGATRIVSAAAFAACTEPELRGKEAAEVTGRRVVAVLASTVGIRPAEIAWALGVTSQAANRLAQREAPGAHIQATRLRLTLEEAVAELPPVVREPEPPSYGDVSGSLPRRAGAPRSRGRSRRGGGETSLTLGPQFVSGRRMGLTRLDVPASASPGPSPCSGR